MRSALGLAEPRVQQAGPDINEAGRRHTAASLPDPRTRGQEPAVPDSDRTPRAVVNARCRALLRPRFEGQGLMVMPDEVPVLAT